MRTGIVVNVTPGDRRRLEAIVGNRNAPQKHVWRAKIILPAPTAAARPRSCDDPASQAGGMAVAGAVHGGGCRRPDAR
jgi:hypothetical protein